MIVASTWREIMASGRILTICCSHDPTTPVPPDEIEIPWQPDGKALTRLCQYTVAVCNWRPSIPKSEVIDTAGTVPRPLLDEIFKAAGITMKSER